MRTQVSFKSQDGTEIIVYKWEAKNPKAVVQIAHGAVEHALRYEDFANALVGQGISVYANDHRGHGQTAGQADNVGYFSDEKNGFLLAVEDMHALTKMIQKENPKLPVVLFGHSMGSLMARVFASKYSDELRALILTGTGRVSPVLIGIVRFFANAHILLCGRKSKSRFLHSLVFVTLNKPFKGETGSEFICSVKEVVDEYAADAFCGNTVTAEFVDELLSGTRQAARKETFAAIRKDLPIFVGAGEFDSMGGKNLAAVKKDVAEFSKNNEVTFKIYDNMRHEILNEKDKQIVYKDIIAWIEAKI